MAAQQDDEVRGDLDAAGAPVDPEGTAEDAAGPGAELWRDWLPGWVNEPEPPSVPEGDAPAATPEDGAADGAGPADEVPAADTSDAEADENASPEAEADEVETSGGVVPESLAIEEAPE